MIHPLKHLKTAVKRMAPAWLLHGYRRFRRQQYQKLFRGDHVICAVCQSAYREFGPFGHPARRNAQCFQCGSLERHRLLWKYLQDRTPLFDSHHRLRLLHMAPEQSFYNIFSTLPHLDYYPADLHPDIVQKQVPVIKADLTALPFPDMHVDVILCSHVLEHIPDDALAMSELHRVLKPGGWAILQVPLDLSRETTYEDFSITSPDARESAFGQRDHVRIYGRDYIMRLERAGFVVKEDDYVNTFSREEQFRYGFIGGELIYYCSRR